MNTRFFIHPKYKAQVLTISTQNLPWRAFDNKSLLITGAAGLIGSFLIDVLMSAKDLHILNCKIFVLGRTSLKLENRFQEYLGDENFHIITQDINQEFSKELNGISPDFIIHLASNTHPLAYSSDPIGTITTNLIGTNNLLEFASIKKTKRIVFASSVEIYGKNRGDKQAFSEDYCGYIDCNTMRAGYPEAKRCGEALCQAYIKQEGLNIVIPRLSRVYGPSMLETDSKAIAQFIKKAVAGEVIVLKSAGTQLYSYSYVADAVNGILYCLFFGENGSAYNISDPESDITLKDLADSLAKIAGTEVVFENPDSQEAAGYSTADMAIMDSSKLQNLGWSAFYPIKQGLKECVEILKTN